MDVINPVSAQDIDAAYMMGDDGDLDADLSALLEVPDLNSTDLASLGPSMTPAALSNAFSPGTPPHPPLLFDPLLHAILYCPASWIATFSDMTCSSKPLPICML